MQFFLLHNNTLFHERRVEYVFSSIVIIGSHHRLRWAAETLVSAPHLSVTAVGEEAGFSSRATFYRLFQQQYGMSPAAYRAASHG